MRYWGDVLAREDFFLKDSSGLPLAGRTRLPQNNDGRNSRAVARIDGRSRVLTGGRGRRLRGMYGQGQQSLGIEGPGILGFESIRVPDLVGSSSGEDMQRLHESVFGHRGYLNRHVDQLQHQQRADERLKGLEKEKFFKLICIKVKYDTSLEHEYHHNM
jgi:hypothetical protein